MKIFFLIGWRNLWRNKRRSLVVITSIALGIFAMMFSMALMNGLNNQMVENTISTSLGHIAFQRTGFQDDMKLQNSLDLSENAIQSLEQTPGILAYAPRIQLEGMIRSSEASRGVLIIGIDPEKEKSVSGIAGYLLPDQGGTFLLNRGDRELLISKTLAEKLDLRVGDKAVILFQDIDREISGAALTVRGLYRSPIDSFDKYVIYTGMDNLAKMAGIGNRISRVVIRTENRDAVDPVAAHLRAAVPDPGIEILTWKDMAPNLLSAVALFDAMMYIFFAIIFTTVVFSIANVLIMAVMERFHEIGVMKSIGTRPVWIGAMVVFEAVNLALAGLIAGVVPGLLLVGALSVTGIDFSFYMESVRVWGTGAVVYPSIKPMDVWVSALIVMGTTLTAAVYPAVKAARIKPLEALHFI